MIYRTTPGGIMDQDYLMHHGIKGQSWGVQNGPPYPLDPYKDYTKAEKKANAEGIVAARKGKKLKDLLKEEITDDSPKLVNVNVKKLMDQFDKIDNQRYDLLEKSENMKNEEAKAYTVGKYEKLTKERNQLIDKIIYNLVGEYGDMDISFIQGTVADQLREDIEKQVEKYQHESFH